MRDRIVDERKYRAVPFRYGPVRLEDRAAIRNVQSDRVHTSFERCILCDQCPDGVLALFERAAAQHLHAACSNALLSVPEKSMLGAKRTRSSRRQRKQRRQTTCTSSVESSRRTIASPIPLLPPVTTTTLIRGKLVTEQNSDP